MAIIIIIALLFPLLCHAAPSITGVSGVVTAGQSITITGSAFGTKAIAAPYKWDDFEGGSNGSDIGNPSSLSYDTTAWELFNTGGNNAKYSNTRARSGELSALSDLTANYNCSIGLDWGARQGPVYLSWWQYHTRTGGPTNYKPYRQYGSNYPNPELNIVCDSTGCWHPTSTDAGVYADNWGGESSMPAQGEWQRWELYISTGTPAGNDGFVYWWRDGVNKKTLTGLALLSDGSAYGFNQLRVQNYLDRASGTMYVWTDDIYIDTTLQRIELCSGSTWASKGTCEIQIPTAWATSAITATVNRGAFGTTDSVYLYVIDNNGNANTDGHAVTFGQGYSPSSLSGCTLSGASLY